ncbi:hypothetical protein CFP59_09295 [Streptomyces malaysiensis subsp. malaysiensis]|nr:hypothetical protein CFP59_09295 [Streptomyces sp. M56]
MVSIRTGSFALTAAGPLDGLRATGGYGWPRSSAGYSSAMRAVSDEGAAHRLRRAISAGSGDLSHTIGPVFERSPGVFQAYTLDLPAGCRPGLHLEGTGKVPRGEAGALCEALDGQIPVRVLGDPLPDLAHVANEAVGGRPVVIDLSVRRLYCAAPTCRKLTFVEQAEGLTERYQRRSPTLKRVVEAVAVALADSAGARLLTALHQTVPSASVLNCLMPIPVPPA